MRLFGNRKWSIPQLNRGVEMTYVMQRQTDHVDVSRVLIIVMTIKIIPINGRETATAYLLCTALSLSNFVVIKRPADQ